MMVRWKKLRQMMADWMEFGLRKEVDLKVLDGGNWYVVIS